MKKSDIYWQTYLNLEKEAIEVSKYIFIADEIIVNRNGVEVEESCNNQLLTFSPHLADLLVRCCVQIEAISKELYYDNGGAKSRGDTTILFDVDCLKLIDQKWETYKKQVLVVAPFFNLTKEENRVLKPLKEAHKRKTYWGRAYQAVKHDRYSSLSKGNVKAFIQALAALYLLNIYYRNVSWIVKMEDFKKLDYSMGSSLFSVKAPVVGQLWYGNEPTPSESPFMIKYVDDDYKKIDEKQKNGKKELNEYLMSQPEMKEPAFISQLSEAAEREKIDPKQKLILSWELSKYKMNKKIPAALNLEEKKKKLLESDEWNGWINQHNKHLLPEEITEDNIQAEIERVAVTWGMEIEKHYLSRYNWLQLAFSSASCKVYIPEYTKKV